MTKRKFLLFCLSPSFYTNQRLIEECDQQGHTLIATNPFEKSLCLSSDNSSQDISGIMLRTSAFQYDDYDLLAARILSGNEAKVVNPIQAFMQLRDKSTQAYTLQTLQVPQVETHTIKSLTDFPSQLRGRKLVVKTQRGLGGKGVFDMQDDKELEAFISKHAQMGDHRYIVQPMIEDKLELRALVITDKAEVVVEKIPRENNFKGNKAWSDCSICTPSPEITNQLNEIIDKLKELKLSYYALDLFIKDNQLLVLEVNLLPGLEVLEKVSGKNLALKILKQSLFPLSQI